ncbi:hypothetical protein [Olleya aquimaris]|uniref:Uncharacterized protein n=1 Tax=Olleya aquimaris TaxID=639310 RepID=A0A327RQ51_9FLAO|nr:hypothetical protein [Olleya aquimaris]RAJ18092.1 hypothetical protein LY08_00365 [Olleya aquimaris]
MKNVTLTTLFIIVLILSFLLFKECEKSADCNFDPPTDLITNAEANTYEEAYKTKYENLPEIIAANNGVMPEDVRDVWFDLKVMQDYLNYVKEESEIQGKENPGIRVYFGAKEIDGQLKNTVFFSPTYREAERDPEPSDNKNNYDIQSYNYGNAGMPPTEYEGGD